ncbi:hypothetical protein PR003_g11662 [Phytophthora rubi]|uniref:RxLR effector protein n=1 Tax=Phytophthora rubi TaxID=129364 RepID=A0A6A4FFE4_9STRA|nr:hypothetical protein PR003_g11662 [Phytophthora rubi]
MRVHYAVLLIAAAFLASANAASVTTPTFDRSLTAAQRDVTAQRFLRIHYTEEGGEERGIATAVEKTKSLLTPSKISQKTLERWVKNKKSPKNALTRLNLDNVEDKLLTSPQFKTWATFMTMANKQNPEAAMISTLATRYSDDVLSQMIIAAKSARGTKGLATQLQAGQMSLWKSSGKSADDVFGLLGLKNAGGKLFDNPEFATWIKYVDDLSEGNSKKASLMMTSTLATQYSDKAILKMVAAAKKVPATKSVATRLEAAQIENWLSTNKSPADTFKLFGLRADDSLLANPTLNSWVKYLDDFNTKNPKDKTTMVETFTTHYTDEGLYQMLKAAREVETTKKMATDLQHAQLANWLATKQNPRDVHRWMGVKGSATDSVERVAYRKYFNDYNAKYLQ